MNWTTQIQLSSRTYFIMMSGAAVICLYSAGVQLFTEGFSYHVLIQLFLAANALYLFYRKIFSGRPGFSVEIFFIVMGGIVAFMYALTGITGWFYFRSVGYIMRPEVVGLQILNLVYFGLLGIQVLAALAGIKRATRRREQFRL